MRRPSLRCPAANQTPPTPCQPARRVPPRRTPTMPALMSAYERAQDQYRPDITSIATIRRADAAPIGCRASKGRSKCLPLPSLPRVLRTASRRYLKNCMPYNNTLIAYVRLTTYQRKTVAISKASIRSIREQSVRVGASGFSRWGVEPKVTVRWRGSSVLVSALVVWPASAFRPNTASSAFVFSPFLHASRYRIL
uniref:Uncharacterized protein n=1 Tax=Plectus sambesii TaxID=2011161 RepID=A0A914WWI8_9BILA